MAEMKGNLTSGLKWALIVGASLRVLFYCIADNNGGDAIVRASRIGQWMNHPTFSGPDPIWGAAYFYLAGTLGFMLKDPELAGRLLSMVCGIGSIYLVFRLASNLAGETAGVLSAWVCAISGLHIGYSTTSSSEMCYLFFLLFGLVGFFEYKTSDRLVPLAWGGVCYTISTGIRYESWIFLPFLSLLLVWPLGKLIGQEFWRSKRTLGLILFAVLFGAWPIMWTVFSWSKWGDPLYAVHLNGKLIHQFASESIRPQPYRLSLPVGVLLLSLSPLPFAGALYAIARCWKRSLPRRFLILSVGFALVQYFQIWEGTVISNARYTLTLFILGVVLCGIGVSESFHSLAPVIARRLAIVLLATMALTQIAIWAGSESRMPFNEKLASISPRLRYAHYILDMATALRPRLTQADAVIIDRYNWEDNIVAHALRLPLEPSSSDSIRWSADPQSLDRFIRTARPRFLVYSDQGIFEPYMKLPERCIMNETVAGMRLNCIFSNPIYRVYEIRYSSDLIPVELHMIH